MRNPNLLDCVIYGGGGHAAVAIECLRLSGSANPVAVLDDGLPVGTAIDGVSVLGGGDMAGQLLAQGVRGFFCGVGSTGYSAVRKRIYENAVALGFTAVTAIHPGAVVSNSVEIGDGALVSAGAIISTGAKIGINVIINTGAIIDHHCVIGEHAHIASGAVLSGAVVVGPCAHVGAGAAIMQQIRVGANSVVGVGATVVKDVPDRMTVFGERARTR